MRTPDGVGLGGERERALHVGRAVVETGEQVRVEIDHAAPILRTKRGGTPRPPLVARARRPASARPRRRAGAAGRPRRRTRAARQRRPPASRPAARPTRRRRPPARPRTARTSGPTGSETGRCSRTASTRRHAGDEDRDAVGDRGADGVPPRDQQQARAPRSTTVAASPAPTMNRGRPSPYRMAIAERHDRLDQQRREHHQQHVARARRSRSP